VKRENISNKPFEYDRYNKPDMVNVKGSNSNNGQGKMSESHSSISSSSNDKDVSNSSSSGVFIIPGENTEGSIRPSTAESMDSVKSTSSDSIVSMLNLFLLKEAINSQEMNDHLVRN